MSAPALDSRGLVLRALAILAFGQAPTHSARAPGRVNLLGDHIDYCDLPVLPMAIQRDLRIDFSPRADARVRLRNADPRYEAAEFDLSTSIAPAVQGHWSNYVRAAAQMLARELGCRRGIDAVVHGDVPPAAGLSSSSALLVASALALLRANRAELPRLELARACALAESYVGTNSGGMDQAVSLLARAGHALRVDFAPLRSEAIAVPENWRFVIADSLVVADKSGSLRESYNARRAASETALALVARHPRLAGVPAHYPALIERCPHAELLALGAQSLSGELLRRFRHVVTEAARVERACAALRAADAAAFGAAMDESHASLREDCEVSTPELDELVRIAKRHGALGARISGAGLGGAIVALVEAPRAEALLEGLAEDWLAPRRPAGERENHLLLAEASAGAEG